MEEIQYSDDYLNNLGSKLMGIPKCVRNQIRCNLKQQGYFYPKELIKEDFKIGGIDENNVLSIIEEIDKLNSSTQRRLSEILDEKKEIEEIDIKNCLLNATLWTSEPLILEDKDGNGYKISSHSNEDDAHREISLASCEEKLNSYLKKMKTIEVGNKYKLYYEYDEEVVYDDIFKIESITVKMEVAENGYVYCDFIINTDKGEIDEKYFSNYIRRPASISRTICSCEKVE